MAVPTATITSAFRRFSRCQFSRANFSRFHRSYATADSHPSKFFATLAINKRSQEKSAPAAASTTISNNAPSASSPISSGTSSAASSSAVVSQRSSSAATQKLAAMQETAPLAKIAAAAAAKSRERKFRAETKSPPPNIFAYATCERYDVGRLTDFFKSATSSHNKVGVAATVAIGNKLYAAAPVGFELGAKIVRPVERPSVVVNEKCSTSTTAADGNQISNANNSSSNSSSGEILIFRDGSVVFWDVDEYERTKFLDSFLPRFEIGSFVDRQSVKNEVEKLTYVYNEDIDVAHFKQHEILHLKCPLSRQDAEENFLAKFAISDAMSRSVKLAIRENALSDFVDNLNPIVENLKRGKIRVKKQDVLTKTGQLFALRHDISLDSDLLDDLPDFYWERGDSLERLYAQTSRIFCIRNRTKVINEKLTYCMQLGERLDTHLSTKHSVRLERIIIFLIAIEVAFEMAPYFVDLYQSIIQRKNDVEVATITTNHMN